MALLYLRQSSVLMQSIMQTLFNAKKSVSHLVPSERHTDHGQTSKQANTWVNRHTKRQVIRNRCSGGQRVRQTESGCCVRDGVTREMHWQRRHVGTQEASRCSLWDRRLRGTELSLYPPVIVTVWDNTAAQERFGRNFWGVACGVVELTGIPRHYIPFQLPVKRTTVKWLLRVTSSKLWLMGFFFTKAWNKTE